MERFKTLKDHVYEYIEEQIMKGTLGSLTPPSSKNLSKRCKRLIFLSIS